MLEHILLFGVVNAAQILLIAVGFSLTFGLTGIANFAHSAFYLLSGFVFWILLYSVGLPRLLALPLTLAILAVIGALTYRLIIAPVRGIVLSEVIATFALGVAILEIFRWLGFVTYDYSLPPFARGQVVILGESLDYQRIAIVVIAAVVTVGLFGFMRRTKTGRALRAVAQDEDTAISLGIRSEWAATISVGLGAALAAVAGVTILPLGILSINIGYEALLIALAATVLGGVESLAGLVLSSTILGFTLVIVSVLLGPQWSMVVYLAAIVIMLAVKPSGLLGRMHVLEERV